MCLCERFSVYSLELKFNNEQRNYRGLLNDSEQDNKNSVIDG